MILKASFCYTLAPFTLVMALPSDNLPLFIQLPSVCAAALSNFPCTVCCTANSQTLTI